MQAFFIISSGIVIASLSTVLCIKLLTFFIFTSFCKKCIINVILPYTALKINPSQNQKSDSTLVADKEIKLAADTLAFNYFGSYMGEASVKLGRVVAFKS